MMRILFAAAMVAGLGAGSQASAALTTFIGADNSVTSLAQMINSKAAAAAFDTAVPHASVITFETSLPANVSVTGGAITTNVTPCDALCGFNTTAGGQKFYSQFGGTATFTFTAPIDAFGLYVTGLQTDLVSQETLTFSDGSSQTIDTPSATGGGAAFIGFTDAGKSISSVSYNATGDIVGLDDVQFGNVSSVPEPASWALMLVGAGGLGLAMRSRRKYAVAAA